MGRSLIKLMAPNERRGRRGMAGGRCLHQSEIKVRLIAERETLAEMAGDHLDHVPGQRRSEHNATKERPGGAHE